MLLVGIAGFLAATPMPEIDPRSAGSAALVLFGTVLILKKRRDKQKVAGWA